MVKKILIGVTGVVSGLVLVVLVTVGCVLYVPAVRHAVLERGIAIANEQTDWDVELGNIYLSPFHHSPLRFYRAYQGTEDLPLDIEIDSLFVGHRGVDTLIYSRSLRLHAKALTSRNGAPLADGKQLLSTPIEVTQLRLDETAFHSDSLIAAVGVDAVVGLLDVTSPELIIAKGQYPLHGLRLNDAYVGIDLRTPADTVPKPQNDSVAPLLMTFDVPDGELRNIHFALTPLDLHVRTQSLSTKVLVDVSGNTYDAQRLDIGGASLTIGKLSIPIDSLYGNARVDLAQHLITSSGLHARADELGARADLAATKMDLQSMRIDVRGDAEFQGSKARLRAFYDIDDQAYDLQANIERVDLSAFMPEPKRVVIAGDLSAAGQGIDPNSAAMKSRVKLHLTDAIYDTIDVSGLQLDARLADRAVEGTLHLPVRMRQSGLQVSARTEHQFRVAKFMTPQQIEADYRAQLYNVRTRVGKERFNADNLHLHFTTADSTALAIATPGLEVEAATPMHVLSLVNRLQPLLKTASDSNVIQSITSLTDLTMLDTLRRLIPPLDTRIVLTPGSPVQPIIDRTGLAIRKIALSLHSDTALTDLTLDASMPEINHPEDSTALRLPAAQAALQLGMKEGQTTASLAADTRLTDGAMQVYGLCTDAALRMDIQREGNTLRGDGELTMDSLYYNNAEIGRRTVALRLRPSETYDGALRAEVETDNIPLAVVQAIVEIKDIALDGAVQAKASVDGLPGKTDISAQVQPLGVRAEYTPYEVGLGLGDRPIVMEHNKLDLNGLQVIGADSTYITFHGGMDLNSRRMDITFAADSFAPVKLPKGGPIPVYGDLATDIRGAVTGPLDSIVADVDVTLLPTTDITYPIDKKNLAQVKPHGTVNVRYAMADSVPLNLGGQVNVDDGFVRYSPKAYPIMPFHVDSGSHVRFQGPIGQTLLDVSASQKVKADVESEDEETRRVEFTTGVRVNGVIDSIGLNAINFFLEAPEDETITHELESVDEDTREGLAATLLATGMYVGESNVAAQRGGYALSSILNSRLNAAMANSKMGKFVDIDLSSAQTEHTGGTTNDFNIEISKAFFHDRFRVTVGSTITDNPEVNQTSGLLNNLSAEYQLTKEGNVFLRAFSQRDYNNILEGDLYKSGLGVRAKQEWRKSKITNNKSQIEPDTITRVYGLTADADVAWRSNNSLGPNLTLNHTIKNLLGEGETFSIKGNGAYYWALRNRHPGDPKKTDTYKLGVSASFVFPYLHWVGDDNPDGNTRYMVSYQYENIAGGYGVHKVAGSFTYFIHSSRYITHAFTPFSLSVVRVKAESDSSMISKAAEYPQLMKILASPEFVPSIGYTFTYNDYRSDRPVNTMLELGVKESGNIINGIYCLFGQPWNKVNKAFGNITFNQFVKLTAELRNKFNITDRVCIATRLFAGANIPLGNSIESPLSEAFYAGGPNSMRAASPYAYGPGNFYSEKFNQNFFHAGDVKLEANFELRFPIVWKLYGATFVDAGNVWSWYNSAEKFKEAGITDYVERLQLREELYDGIIGNPYLAKQIALGTGAGLRLDLDGLVIRLDLGVAIHTPYLTYRYNKEWKPDTTQPITNYFNIPSGLDALRVNFGIGYPF